MRFYLYATDNVDPAAASNVTEWGLDPIEGEYDSEFEWEGRGSVTPTLGGVVIQDYGTSQQDRKLRVAGRGLDAATRAALESKYLAPNTEYHFIARKSSGAPADVFKVQFRRVPRGFTAQLDAPTFAIGRMISEPAPAGYERYRYELVLLVVEKVA